MIQRSILELIQKRLFKGKAIILIGPRQVGKTTLLNQLCKENKLEYLFFNGDDPIVQQQLSTANTQGLKQLLGNYKVIFVDEAQRIQNIGLTLKLITDQMKDIQILVSGSSALEVSGLINEPLTGRKWEYVLYPISWVEFVQYKGYLESLQQLEQRLIYGMYPEVITHQGEERLILQQLMGSYLYQDILSISGIRKPEILDKLLRALALQLGQEISYNELSNLLQIDKNTVQEYIRLLEKVFLIFRLQPLARNLRNEISSTRKIYFYDNGIRNAIIANFNEISLRLDVGALWENFLISERMKTLHYQEQWVNPYFWRTSAQQEIDYVEERNGVLHAFEFKWNSNKKVKVPKSFIQAYPESSATIISPENFFDFVSGKI